MAILISRTPDQSGRFGEVFQKLHFFWLLPAVFLYGVHVFANAWRWWILLKAQKLECSLWTAVSLTMQSFFFSLVMPGGALGGDVVRAGFIANRVKKEQRFDGVFTILIDRFTGMIGLFLMALVMIVCAWNTVNSTNGTAKSLVWVLTAGAAAGIVGSMVIFCHRRLERFALWRGIRKIGDRFSGGLFTKTEDALDSYQSCRKELLLCIAASLIGVNFVLGLTAWFISWSVSGSAVWFIPALAAITVGNIGGLLPLTPSGIGVRDYFVMTILVGGGMTQSDGLAVALVMSALIIFYNLLGGLFFLFDRVPKKI